MEVAGIAILVESRRAWKTRMVMQCGNSGIDTYYVQPERNGRNDGRSSRSRFICDSHQTRSGRRLRHAETHIWESAKGPTQEPGFVHTARCWNVRKTQKWVQIIPNTVFLTLFLSRYFLTEMIGGG